MKLIFKISFLALLCHLASPLLAMERKILLHQIEMKHIHAVPSGFEPLEIYLEVAGNHVEPLLGLELWHAIIKENMNLPEPTISFPEPIAGNMFDGSYGYTKYHTQFSPSGQYNRLTVNWKGNKLLHNYLIPAGGKIRIRIDPEHASIVFSGPDADLFQLQQHIRVAFAREEFARPPIMITANPDNIKNRPSLSKAYQDAESNASDVRHLMRFFDPAQDAQYVESLISKDWKEHPAILTLPQYHHVIAPDLLQILEADIEGMIKLPLFKAIARVGDNINPKMKNKVEALLQEHPVPLGGFSPFYISAKLEAANVAYGLGDISFYDFLDGQPPLIRDMAYASFVTFNYNLLEDPSNLLTHISSTVTTPWIADLLTKFLTVRIPGASLSEGVFYDEEQKAYTLESLKSKTVLLSFWINGCKFCADYKETVLAPLKELTAKDPDILLIAIGADHDYKRWQLGLQSGKYVPSGILSWWAGGESNALINLLHITSFPYKLIISPDLKIYMSTVQAGSAEEIYALLKNAKINN